jgi:hypothetical protein
VPAGRPSPRVCRILQPITLDAHVYHPDRLQQQQVNGNNCIEVRGTIRDMRVEKDGDYHILLTLDSTQPDGEKASSLLNAKNKQIQHDCLVLESICKGHVTQADAIQPCQGAKKISVPAIGSHVSVVGHYVLDTEGGHGWKEIHPVTKIKVIP